MTTNTDLHGAMPELPVVAYMYEMDANNYKADKFTDAPPASMPTLTLEAKAVHALVKLSDARAAIQQARIASPAPPKQQPALGRGEGGGVPLTDEQIDALWDKPLTTPQKLQRRFMARAIEAAHGIGIAPTGQINPDSAGQGMDGGDHGI